MGSLLFGGPHAARVRELTISVGYSVFEFEWAYCFHHHMIAD